MPPTTGMLSAGDTTHATARMLVRALLYDHEGVRRYPYDDSTGKPPSGLSGKLTIGVGRNLTDVGLRPSEVTFLLDNDIREAEAQLDAMYPWWRKMDAVRQAALWDLMFNLGPTRLSKFTTTLPLLSQGQYRDAAHSLRRSLWYRQVGRRGVRITEMVETGKAPVLPPVPAY